MLLRDTIIDAGIAATPDALQHALTEAAKAKEALEAKAFWNENTQALGSSRRQTRLGMRPWWWPSRRRQPCYGAV